MTALTEPVRTLPAGVAGGAPLFALWEVTATEQGDPVTFFVVTDSPADAPDVARAQAALRTGPLACILDAVHSVRRVTRIRSEREAGRFAGTVITDAIADQRARVVSPRDLGVGA